MPNDSRSVGRPPNSQSRMEPRMVPVQHDKARINDQRKVRPHAASEPAMGVRPSGGAQKEPKKPSLGKERMQAREVPIERMTEAELNEWNPFRRYSKAPLPIRGDVLAWRDSPEGIHVLHIRDGHIVGEPTLVLSKDILNKRMKDAMQQYWQAKNDKFDLRFHRKQAGMAAINRYAKDNGITPVKSGEYGKDIPVATGFHSGAAAPANAAPETAAPAPVSAPQASSPGRSPQPASAGTPWGHRGEPMQNVRRDFWNSRGGERPQAPASAPNQAPAGPGPTAAAPLAGDVASKSVGPQQKHIMYKNAPEYFPPGSLDNLSPYQLAQQWDAFVSGKPTKGMMNNFHRHQAPRMAAESVHEAYPDTSYEHDDPTHESNIGDLGWHGHMAEPVAPALNKEFMQARELRVEKIHEIADQEMERLARGIAARLGYKGIVFEDEVATGHPHFKHIKNGTRVTIRTPHGQERAGRAVMRGPHGWVLNMGGRHGTPGIANPHNTVKVHGGVSAEKASRLAPTVESVIPRIRARWIGEISKRQLSVPDRHQLRIARDTMKMSDAGAGVMGGPNKDESRAIIKRLTGKDHKEPRPVREEGHLPSPTKALPGNIAGSGKDFRPKPGVNKSKKQPGNLIGSRHVTKVKPGFVG